MSVSEYGPETAAAEKAAQKKVRRSPVRRKPKSQSKAVWLFAISVVLGIMNVVLFVQLGIALR